MEPIIMQPTRLIQNENSLNAEFIVNHTNLATSCLTSPEYYISGLAKFQVRCEITQINGTYDFKSEVSIKVQNLHQDEDLIYFILVTSDSYGIEDRTYLIDESEWRIIHNFVETARNCKVTHALDISVVLGVVTGPSLFKSLSEDVESTDFQLRGKDGSIKVHRAVLAAYSPVLRTMFSGEWKETSEGVVKLPGVTKETLEHLRDYMYLHKLPDTGLEQLLSLASCYMMSELMKLCSVQMLLQLNEENHVLFMVLATQYKLKTLFLGIQESVKHGIIKPIANSNYFGDNHWI